VILINLIKLLLYCEEEFSLKERVFYGDGGRIIKVKVKKDGYARAFNVPTKMNRLSGEIFKVFDVIFF